MLFLVIFILTLAAGLFLPWWAIAVIAFITAVYFGTKPAQAFWSGFGAVFVVWILIGLYKSIPNNNMLAMRVAVLFHLPHWSSLLLITGLIGGLTAGLASLSGLLVKRVFEKEHTVAG